MNSVAPGSIRFPGGSWDRRAEADPEGMARFVEQNIAMGRFGRAEEVANVVAFLCSRESELGDGRVRERRRRADAEQHLILGTGDWELGAGALCVL